MNNENLNIEQTQVKVRSADKAEKKIPKSLFDLGVWVLILMTWYNAAAILNSNLIKQVLPALVIITMILIIRTFETPVKKS